MQSRTFRFFATEEEIEKCLLEVEQDQLLKYIVMKNYDSPELEIYYSIVDVPNIGISKYGIQGDEFYLIVAQESEVVLSSFKRKNGNLMYGVGDNPNGVLIYLNGMYKNECLVWNVINTMREPNEVGISLFKDITKRIKKISRKPRPDCYISKGAEELYHQSNGKLRLVPMGWDEPREYDVKL